MDNPKVGSNDNNAYSEIDYFESTLFWRNTLLIIFKEYTINIYNVIFYWRLSCTCCILYLCIFPLYILNKICIMEL